jgi:hypothetical protein
VKCIARLFLGALALSTSISLQPAHAAEQCGIPTAFGLGCRVYVENYESRMRVRQQHSKVTCWAAILSNLLSYYHYNLTEQEILNTITGGEAKLGTVDMVNDALSHEYTLSNGDSITLSAQSTDRFTGTSNDLTNDDIYDALAANKPVFYGDVGHAMVLVDAVFVEGAAGHTPIAAVAADPAPNVGGFRRLQWLELTGLYAAIVTVN